MRRAAPVAALCLAGWVASAAALPPPAGEIRATVPVTIEGRGAVRHFQVEVARTPGEQERGLMFRRSLPADGGMLFPIRPADETQMWMKGTRLSLDILFIRPDGTIARIAGRAQPYSLDVIDSGEPVAAVLEIPGGQAAALGIRPGDHVRWQEGVATP